MKLVRYNWCRFCIASNIVLHGLLMPSLNAQKVIGIYIKPTDMLTNELAYHRGDTKKFKIKTHSFFYKPYVTINKNNSKTLILKNSLFGYQDKTGNIYCFYNHKEYRVISVDTELVMYNVLVVQKSKYEPAVYDYYFSIGLRKPLIPLTIKNLEIGFSNNAAFLIYMKTYFKSDKDLQEFDINHNIYKLQELLNATRISIIKK